MLLFKRFVFFLLFTYHFHVLFFYFFISLCEYSTQISSSMFFSHNEALGPPYRIIVDTNFINHSIKRKMDIVQSMMDCLLAKCLAFIYSSHFISFFPRYRHTMHHRLCYGRTGKARAKVSSSVANCERSSI